MSRVLYKLRSVKRDNLADIEVLNLMAYHPLVMKAKGYWQRGFDFEKNVNLSDVDKGYFASNRIVSRRKSDIFYGVSDPTGLLVGWVWFYADKQHPLPTGVQTRLGVNTTNANIYQISYEKLMSKDWPIALLEKMVHVRRRELLKPRKGVIVEGLRLAIGRVKRAYQKIYAVKRRLVFYAFTHPTNIASKKVLEKNGFVKEKRKYAYDSVPHYLWIKVV